jgi:hypothetical protein
MVFRTFACSSEFFRSLFSRAAIETQDVPALAAEGRIECIQTIPQGLKPRRLLVASGTAKAVPFQNNPTGRVRLP